MENGLHWNRSVYAPKHYLRLLLDTNDVHKSTKSHHKINFVIIIQRVRPFGSKGNGSKNISAMMQANPADVTMYAFMTYKIKNIAKYIL